MTTVKIRCTFAVELIKRTMNVNRISVESRVFRAVDRLYPQSQIAILNAWKEGKGWVPFIDLMKKAPNLTLFSAVLKHLDRNGYRVVQLEIMRKRKVVAQPDYRISELH